MTYARITLCFTYRSAQNSLEINIVGGILMNVYYVGLAMRKASIRIAAHVKCTLTI